jgi:hypothetical protein
MINARELLDLADEIDAISEQKDLQLNLSDEEMVALVNLYKAGKAGLPYDQMYDHMMAMQYVEAINSNTVRVTPKGLKHAENIMYEYGKTKFKKYQW